MNKTQRIYLSSGDTGNENQDKYIKVKLEQNTDTLEFMSLRLGTADVYQNFNADYGVLIGRVLANNSVGIPNARISIFIPLTDEDSVDKDIYSLYPYKTPRDKNNEGKRYNLLPRVSQQDPVTGIVTPKQPFGSFPIKEEIVGNLPFLNVYKKYYKYTALTNNSGDYMIFGVPVGTQTVHLSVDITDIGEYSMNPAAMVTNLGYSPNLFTNNNSKIKPSNDLNDLPNIETQEISVDIVPFWGDVENFEIGITRQDFRIRSVLKNTFVVFGSVYTDASGVQWGQSSGANNEVQRLYEMSSGTEGIGIKTKRVGTVTEKIYYYPANVTDDEINNGSGVAKMALLDPAEYSVYKKDGDFVVIINCNRDKVTIKEDGTKTPVDDSFAGGLYTSFKGFMTLEISEDTLPLDWTKDGSKTHLKPIRHILKFPQTADYDWNTKVFHSFKNPAWGSATCQADAKIDNNAWRQQYFNFCGGCIYSVARFHGLVYNNNDHDQTVHRAWFQCDYIMNATYSSVVHNTGLIQTNDYEYTGNTFYEMPSNSSIGGREVFGANWMNLSVYLPQSGWVTSGYAYNDQCPRSNAHFTHDQFNTTYYEKNNTQVIADGYVNTCSFARSDYHWTDFIEVPKEDIIALNDYECKGIKTSTDGVSLPLSSYDLKGTYRSGCRIPTGQAISWSAAAPPLGGKCNGCCDCNPDCRTYIFKGFDSSDVINYIVELGLI